MSTPALSVVVIGRNEGTRLERCLASIQRMNRPGEIEIIYVDSASMDGSPALAASMGAKVISVQPSRPTAALGRNAGWRAASAPFVLFLDGDTILDPGFVNGALPDFDAATAIVWGIVAKWRRANLSTTGRLTSIGFIRPASLNSAAGMR